MMSMTTPAFAKDPDSTPTTKTESTNQRTEINHSEAFPSERIPMAKDEIDPTNDHPLPAIPRTPGKPKENDGSLLIDDVVKLPNGEIGIRKVDKQEGVEVNANPKVEAPKNEVVKQQEVQVNANPKNNDQKMEDGGFDNFFLLDENKEAFENKGQKKDGEDFCIPSDAEINAAKIATRPKKPWMTDLEGDRMKQGISSAGEGVGKELVKIMQGSYDSADEASNALALATLKGINEGIIKNIPWVGGLFHGMLAQVLYGDEQVNDRMDDVIAEIKNVTNEVSGLRADIKASDEQKALCKKINETNTVLTQLTNLYDKHNNQFFNVIKRATEGAEMTKADLDEISYIYSTDREMIKDNRAVDVHLYYDTYKAFVDTMLNTGIKDQDAYGGNDNIFGWTDKAWSYGKNDIMEIYEQRRDFVNAMEEVFNQGYSVLSTSIAIEGQQLNASTAMCKEQIAKYTEMLNKTQDAQKRKEITATIQSYKEIIGKNNTRLLQVEGDYLKLTKKQNEVFLAIYDQKMNILNDKKEFDAKCRNYSVDYKGKTFTMQNVIVTEKNRKGEKVEKTVEIYPTVNEKDQKIEYRDKFGYLYATQNIVGTKNVKSADLKIGETYVVDAHYADIWSYETREITVTGFHNEKPKSLKNILFGWAGWEDTAKYVDATYRDGDKEVACKFILGDEGNYKAFRSGKVAVGDIEMKREGRLVENASWSYTCSSRDLFDSIIPIDNVLVVPTNQILPKNNFLPNFNLF